MNTSTLTSKGQVTIPAEIRHALKLHTGDHLVFELFDGKIQVYKKKNDITQAFGMYTVNKKVSLNDIQKAIEKGYDDDSH
jgi:AbrB family looped-hinge helix DNA binding protein